MSQPLVWQEQSHDGGCGYAALGVLTDTPYARVAYQCEAIKLEVDANGVDGHIMLHYLTDAGYAYQIKREFVEYDNTTRKPWPPRPWADRHLVCLWQTKEDYAKDMVKYGHGVPFDNSHYVAMDRKGMVFDSADSEYTRCKLSRYYKVAWIAGLFKVE